jgi:hypothetical protein
MFFDAKDRSGIFLFDYFWLHGRFPVGESITVPATALESR